MSSRLFKVPFELDPDYDLTEVIERNGQYLKFDRNDDYTIDITGSMDDLVNFFQDACVVWHPSMEAQSFPIDEFKEWAALYEVDENGIPV